MMQYNNKVIVFDLDDTLYKEIDYLKSGFCKIAQNIGIEEAYQLMLDTYFRQGNPFETIISKYKLHLTIDELLKIYRNHKPKIYLDHEIKNTLTYLYNNCILGLITDGRSISQRNKISSLGLNHVIHESNIIISEEIGVTKSSEKGFLFFMNKYPNCYYYYIGDNTLKDFLIPNKLGWKTICLLDNGENIHKQNFELINEYLPNLKIRSFNELIKII